MSVIGMEGMIDGHDGIATGFDGKEKFMSDEYGETRC